MSRSMLVAHNGGARVIRFGLAFGGGTMLPLTGLYLTVLPHATQWRGGRRNAE